MRHDGAGQVQNSPKSLKCIQPINSIRCVRLYGQGCSCRPKCHDVGVAVAPSRPKQRSPNKRLLLLLLLLLLYINFKTRTSRSSQQTLRLQRFMKNHLSFSRAHKNSPGALTCIMSHAGFSCKQETPPGVSSTPEAFLNTPRRSSSPQAFLNTPRRSSSWETPTGVFLYEETPHAFNKSLTARLGCPGKSIVAQPTRDKCGGEREGRSGRGVLCHNTQ